MSCEFIALRVRSYKRERTLTEILPDCGFPFRVDLPTNAPDYRLLRRGLFTCEGMPVVGGDEGDDSTWSRGGAAVVVGGLIQWQRDRGEGKQEGRSERGS
jgi:hypothetical protein